MFMINKIDRQNGAVSLFVVVFATLLISVVIVSFVRLMVNDEQQASTIDLSQSAYDSAQAGVEDGKRALLRYQNICSGTDSSACDAAFVNLTSEDCNVSLTDIVDISGDEVKIQQNLGDNALDQAYTCVKVQWETADYLGSLQAGESIVIPLTSRQAFDTVQLEWYTADDLQTTGDLTVSLPNNLPNYPLLAQSEWDINTPSVLRSQLIQAGSSFSLGDFDSVSNLENNASTLFLYPTVAPAIPSSTASFLDDKRRGLAGEVTPVECYSSLSGGGYACRVKLSAPSLVVPGSIAYMRLSAFYNQSNYRVSLLNGASTVALFNGVQPEIDATGRANDLFRRVQTRVELRDVNFPYPEAAVDVTGNFCKDFLITNNVDDYVNNCTP